MDDIQADIDPVWMDIDPIDYDMQDPLDYWAYTTEDVRVGIDMISLGPSDKMDVGVVSPLQDATAW